MNCRTIKKYLLVITILVQISCSKNNTHYSHLRIWYDTPANSSVPDLKEGWENDPEWLKALPVGNGSIGAMVFGDVNQERIQINEKTLWSGSPDDNNNPEAAQMLSVIRQLLFEGKYEEAEQLTQKTQVCKGVGSAHGNGADAPFGCYQTLGDLWLDFHKTSDYENYVKELDLERGLVKVSYLQDGVFYQRDIFVSYPDQALIIRFSSDTKQSISFTAKLNRPERFNTRLNNDHLLMHGRMKNGKGGEGMSYAARLKPIAKGGSVEYTDSTIIVKNVDEIILVLTASTDYVQEYPTYKGVDPLQTSLLQLTKISSKPYSLLLESHVNDYTALFSRVGLSLTEEVLDTIPTDRRLQNTNDLYLQQVYFQYGRYLLISSSREGSLPANLQGIWANKIQTPWNSDYHTNINLQMNYWPADVTNLPECFEPLEKLIYSLEKPGEVSAAVQYGAEGWNTQTITNVWGYTSPGEGTGWGLYVAGAGWLCRHLWDHYLFTRDMEFLRSAFPIMLNSARFYLDWLVEDPETGELVSGPSTSPENPFIAPDGSIAWISMGPSHDQQVIWDLFNFLLKASKILGENSPLLSEISTAKEKLAMTRIGADGRLMEWRKDYEEYDPRHRHVSHLYMLYPGDQIDSQKTPELAEAARKSLDARTDVGTGWSLAWKINFWARLKNGNRAYKLLQKLLTPTDNYKINMSDAGGTYNNLFCGHPPFQIDGNFGGTAGIAEMLLQSHNEYVELLPALPDVWEEGKVNGLVARGGFVIDMEWKENELIKVKIFSRNESSIRILYKGKSVEITNLKKGEYKVVDIKSLQGYAQNF